jgi:hypothetical protein
MKKLIFLLLLFPCIKLKGQVYYPNANQDLKEFIAIQSLLVENRLDDLKIFFKNNSYVAIPGKENMYTKFDLDRIKEDNITFLISINSNHPYGYAKNMIRIRFFKYKNDKITVFSLDDCKTIENIIKNIYITGPMYSMISSLSEYKKANGMNVEKIDRYTYKTYSDKKPNEIVLQKASNFFRLADDKIAFFGPGKSSFTNLIYIEPIITEVEGKYYFDMELASSLDENYEKNEKFNVDFFMSLKNFNDRIWQDK